jgi:hypothetical protein
VPEAEKEKVMEHSRQKSRVRHWLAAVTALVLVAALVIPGASVAAAVPRGNAVLDWNQYAVEALGNPLPTAIPAPLVPGAGMTPPVASIHLAMVQGAVYDAVNAIDRSHTPYLRHLPSARRSASKTAAAVTAAHHVLVGLVPALPQVVKDRLDTLYAASLAKVRNGLAKTRGVRIGAAVARIMLARRADDGRYVASPFPVGTLAGEWRPTPPAFITDPFSWVAKVRPFTLRRNSQFRTAGPLDMTSAQYATEFNEVKSLGAAVGSTRTLEQTELGRFYSVNPMPMEYRALREIAAARRLSIAQSARLFAMSSMATADALIGCWDDKAHWLFWRPITAIQEAANDDNPATAPQADWMSFLPNPPYPDHPSGYNCFTAAMMYTARAFFRTDRITFQLTSAVTMTTRTYTRFSAVLTDTINARIYLGIHFRTPDVQGAGLGRRTANWVATHYFLRVHR